MQYWLEYGEAMKLAEEEKKLDQDKIEEVLFLLHKCTGLTPVDFQEIRKAIAGKGPLYSLPIPQDLGGE